MQRQDLWHPVPRMQRQAAHVACFCCYCCGYLPYWLAYYGLQHHVPQLRRCCNNPWCPQIRRKWAAFFGRRSQEAHRHGPNVAPNFGALYNNQAGDAAQEAFAANILPTDGVVPEEYGFLAQEQQNAPQFANILPTDGVVPEEYGFLAQEQQNGPQLANRLPRDGVVPGEYGFLAQQQPNAPQLVNEGAGPSQNSIAQRRSQRRSGRDRKGKSRQYYECNQYCKNCTNLPVPAKQITPKVANIRSQPPHHASLPSRAFFKPIRSKIPHELSILAAPQRSVSPIKIPAIRACQKMPDGTTRSPCGNHSEIFFHDFPYN